jgi:predicted outer membrane protein
MCFITVRGIIAASKREAVKPVKKVENTMKHVFYPVCIWMMCSGMLTACKSNNNSTKNNEVTHQLVNKNDESFLFQAYEAALYAMEISKEGTMRSTSIETKTLAENVLMNNKKIADQLGEIAGKKAIELPLDMNSTQLKKWRELVKEKGWDFDKKFIELAIEHTKNSKTLLADISQRVKDADIKKVAQNILSSLDNQYSIALKTKEIITNRTEKDTIAKPAVIIHQ